MRRNGIPASGKFGLLPPPQAGEGWGGGEVKRAIVIVFPLPVPPAEVGCFRLRPVNKAAELGSTRVRLQAGEGTMSRQHEALKRRKPDEGACAAYFPLTRVTRIFQKSVLTKTASTGTGGTWLPASLLLARERRRAGIPNATLRCKQRPPAQFPCFRVAISNGWHNSRACRRPSRLGAQR